MCGCAVPAQISVRSNRPTAQPPNSHSQAGFTLAGVLVLLTIIAVFAAYTVPRQWSTIMQRERERQTIFLMKQYARAIKEFQKKHNNVYPTSLDQLKEARSPRLIRGVKGGWDCPLTGKPDWILIPPAAMGTGVAAPPRGAPPGGTTGAGGTAGGTTTANPGGQYVSSFNASASPPDYANGPLVGVRPRKSGESLLTLNGATSYEQWGYTVLDLDNEINARIAAAASQFK